MELAYQHHLAGKVLLTVRLPYYFAKTETASNGPGDVSVAAQYIWYSSASESMPLTILAGAGVKAPTGSYNRPDGALEGHSQFFGTGAWDGIITAQAFLQSDQWTFGADGYMQISTSNSDGIKVGNWGAFTLSASKEVFKPEDEGATLLALFGARMETMAANALNGVAIRSTGHSTLFANAGLQAVLLRNLRLSANVLLPAYSIIPEGGHDESARVNAGIQLLL